MAKLEIQNDCLLSKFIHRLHTLQNTPWAKCMIQHGLLQGYRDISHMTLVQPRDGTSVLGESVLSEPRRNYQL